MPFRPVILIPVYNHDRYLRYLIEKITQKDLPVLLVDDGSGSPCSHTLDTIVRDLDNVSLIRHAKNKGKGAAIVTGFNAAAFSGFTHAFQIDADGQHDIEFIETFLQTAAQHPESLICGYPVYDESVPALRLYSRRLTNWWVHINSMSDAVQDAMCGFRIYPLTSTCRLIRRTRIGARMESDPEIAVRLVWEGVEVVNLPVRVTYPNDGVSHFRLFRDNLRISLMHAKLFCLMLKRRFG